MQINWAIVIICVSLWVSGYFFGYSVGKAAGLKECIFGILDRMTEIVEKLPKGREGFEHEQEKSD